jgi:hypothetical protein
MNNKQVSDSPTAIEEAMNIAFGPIQYNPEP